MDYSPAYIIAQYLIDEDLVIDSSESGDWKIFIGALPDGPNTDHNEVGCMDTTPVKDGRPMGGDPLFHHGVQLLLRASLYNTGYAKATELADALAEVNRDQVTVGAVTYQIDNVTQSSGVVVLGQEEGTKRREMFSVNFLATIKEV